MRYACIRSVFLLRQDFYIWNTISDIHALNFMNKTYYTTILMLLSNPNKTSANFNFCITKLQATIIKY
jgi:hypothetical protein